MNAHNNFNRLISLIHQYSGVKINGRSGSLQVPMKSCIPAVEKRTDCRRSPPPGEDGAVGVRGFILREFSRQLCAPGA